MKVLYFDTIAGISGDMTLGAFVSAGMPFAKLTGELSKLNLPGFELTSRHVERSGIVGVRIEVVVSEQPQYHRHLNDISTIIDGGRFSQQVKERSKKIFQEIAVAEARIHHSTVEDVHFHEVGAVDSLVDIVGTAICLEHFGIEQAYSSPVKVGNGGFVQAQHGKMPVPTPAVLEILKSYPTILTGVPSELTTPTGAAIVKALSSGVLSTERLRIEAVGYGVGSRELEEIPNLMRVMIGEMDPANPEDDVVSVETNIDDMNPEIFPHVIERLLGSGAHDAYMIPVIMKKGRPGMLLSTLAERSKLDKILGIIFRETSTLGVRIQPIERRKLHRSKKQVNTSLGPVSVKVVMNDGREVLIPEFEECRKIAHEKKLALIDVYKLIEKEIR